MQMDHGRIVARVEDDRGGVEILRLCAVGDALRLALFRAAVIVHVLERFERVGTRRQSGEGDGSGGGGLGDVLGTKRHAPPERESGLVVKGDTVRGAPGGATL